MKSLFAFFSGLLIATTAMAQEVAPDVLVKNVTNEVLDIVRKDKDIQSGNTKKAIDLVDAKVLPHFNFTRMTQLAMARDWRQTTPAQQKVLTDEFRLLLVRTYSKALTEYKNQTVNFKPFTLKAGETDVRVRTEIKQAGAGKNIELDYFLEKSGTAWKVYDIEVGGISLVTNYRESFASEVRNNGIDGLIKSLQAKNKSGEATSVKK
ncbi:MlaC/ttg2D family ABC transporter substrate-binding protein [Sulfuritalea hydrogenivorans]|jgi:phospholipid transport system substrate-binding protein|uniref:Organic solvent resistance ABC transporter auxiliary protein n=1 Tax=Sulfuritalea hydrogenivorans sk43H TaxID=1223802 RepID=W0SLH5_9PROT|nr:ABC transporter substrate-binding protein [Sulfuritalea hydrogenivorans]BAO30633.1 organic solvent resistance ABC transporter auxiliary protein [Sulfuritalea hydrogenivorans sk43H]